MLTKEQRKELHKLSDDVIEEVVLNFFMDEEEKHPMVGNSIILTEYEFNTIKDVAFSLGDFVAVNNITEVIEDILDSNNDLTNEELKNVIGRLFSDLRCSSAKRLDKATGKSKSKSEDKDKNETENEN